MAADATKAARRLKTIHGWATVVWALLVIPTVIWWGEALKWIALVSVYSPVATHWCAWQASRAESASQDNNPPQE